MKLKTLALMGVICTAAVFTSCKKDDDKKEEPVTVVGTWKITAQTYKTKIAGQDTTMNTYAMMDACEKDDLTKFEADNKYSVSEGASKCDPTDPDVYDSGTWALTDNNTKLALTSGGTTDTYQVLTLNSTTLTVKMVVGTDEVNMTLTKQ